MFKDKYLALVLSDKCREDILGLYPKKFEVIQCHHVTFVYDLLDYSQEDLYAVLSNFERKKIELNGFIQADGIDLFRVLVDGKAQRPDGRYYHLTQTHRTDRKPSDSNKVFTAEINNFGMVSAGRQLDGKLQLLDKSAS